MTAKNFRNTEKPVLVKSGVYYSKNGQLIGKKNQLSIEAEPHLCSVKLKQLIIMDTKVTVKDMPEMNVIYCRHTGAFNPYELYYNNHEDHPEKKFILDVCVPVKTL
jgi:AraC family transcriptional regulator